jgi:hypothetical protein
METNKPESPIQGDSKRHPTGLDRTSAITEGGKASKGGQANGA